MAISVLNLVARWRHSSLSNWECTRLLGFSLLHQSVLQYSQYSPTIMAQHYGRSCGVAGDGCR